MSDIHKRRAEFVYEAARIEAKASKRRIVPEPWSDREEPFRAQFIDTIKRICADGYETTPEREHDSWWRAYEAMGWKYGPVRDVDKKEHPDMVPYNDLPKDERDKDKVFLALCDFALHYIHGTDAEARIAREREGS